MSNVHKVDPGQVPTTAVKSSDVSRIVDQKLKDVESKLDKRYAKVNHTHDSADMSGYASKKHGHSMDDISGLNNAIKKASKVPDTFADKKHRHSVADIDGQIPVEKVKGVDSVVQKGVAGLAKENHRHVNLEKQLSNVEQGIKGLEKVVERKLGSDDKRDLEKMFKEAISELKNELVRIEKEIPTIEDDPVEMVSSRYFLVPEKCNGMMIEEIHAFDFEGNEVKVKMKSKGKNVAEGSKVTTNQLITITPACLVRFVFC